MTRYEAWVWLGHPVLVEFLGLCVWASTEDDWVLDVRIKMPSERGAIAAGGDAATPRPVAIR